jgi:hypothetical protein
LLALGASVVLAGCLGPHASVVTPAPLAAAYSPLPPLNIERPEGSVETPFGPEARNAALSVGLTSAVIQTGTRSVGSTSVVFKVPLDGGLSAAFKPETKKHHGRWRAEVAAYRVSRLLDLDHVPPSVPRAAKMSALLASTRSSVALKLLREQCLPREDGRLPGAMIAWVPGLSRLPLEIDPLWSAWREWLSVLPPHRPLESRLPRASARTLREARALAPQISTLVVFDHLIGNRDRWSGHNVLIDGTHTRVVFLDHNLAFDAKLDVASTIKRNLVLHRVQKFSRALVARLRTLTRAELADAIGLDDLGAPLLDEAQLDATLARRDEILAYVDELVAQFGEEKILAFA